MTTKKQKYLRQLAVDDWGDDVPILISQEAFDALDNFLYEDRAGTGEGYSQFIITAIDMRKKESEVKK